MKQVQLRITKFLGTRLLLSADSKVTDDILLVYKNTPLILLLMHQSSVYINVEQ